MLRPCDTPDASKQAINAILEKNHHLFVQRPVLLAKKEKISKSVTQVTIECGSGDNIYFKTASTDVEPPYLAIFELWEGDERQEYRYELVVPSVECTFRINGIDKQAVAYQFRYEKHSPSHKYPDHIHLMELPAHLYSERIEFGDFFSIITNEFVKNGEFFFEDQ